MRVVGREVCLAYFRAPDLATRSGERAQYVALTGGILSEGPRWQGVRFIFLVMPRSSGNLGHSYGTQDNTIDGDLSAEDIEDYDPEESVAGVGPVVMYPERRPKGSILDRVKMQLQSPSVGGIARKAAAGVFMGTVLGGGFGVFNAYAQIKPAVEAAHPLLPLDILGKEMWRQRIFVAKTCVKTSLVFAGFMGSFWGISKTLDTYRGSESFENIAAAAAVTTVPSLRIATVRRNLPWLGFLVAMDCYQHYSHSS